MNRNDEDSRFMEIAISLAAEGMMNDKGGPFGAVVVKGGMIVGRGNNEVTSSNDPTAHAEVVAIRDACRNLNSFQLQGCKLYTSCEPCPMCFGAIYWSRPDEVLYACDKSEAAEIGFDDQFIYNEIGLSDSMRSIKFKRISRHKGKTVFREWVSKENKVLY